MTYDQGQVEGALTPSSIEDKQLMDGWIMPLIISSFWRYTFHWYQHVALEASVFFWVYLLICCVMSSKRSM